jgi:type 1 glutamine amidotransferase
MNRRKFLASTTAAAALASLGLKAESMKRNPGPGTADKLPSLKGRKILYTAGGWEGHEPGQSVELFKPWLESEGAVVDVYRTLDPYADETYMETVDLVIQAFTQGSITREQENGLLKAVRGGMGITGWHGGLCDAFRNNTEYQFMTGGQWVAHPGGIIDYSIQVTDKKDPVTRGLGEFKVHTEQYYMHVDPNVKVLATTTFTAEHADWIEGCTVPVAWKKMYGKGRVFYSSLGHTMDVFAVPEALEIQKRGIRWASGSRYLPGEKWISPVY